LTKLHNDELPSVKAADLVVWASVYTGNNSSYIVPFIHWPQVKCGLRICGTYNR